MHDYTGAPFAANPDIRWSTSDYPFKMTGVPKVFGAHPQTRKEHSMVESELITISLGDGTQLASPLS